MIRHNERIETGMILQRSEECLKRAKNSGENYPFITGEDIPKAFLYAAKCLSHEDVYAV